MSVGGINYVWNSNGPAPEALIERLRPTNGMGTVVHIEDDGVSVPLSQEGRVRHRPQRGDIILVNAQHSYREFMHVDYAGPEGGMTVTSDKTGNRYGLSWKNSNWYPATLKNLVEDRKKRLTGNTWDVKMCFETGTLKLT